MKWLLLVLALISVSFAAGEAPSWVPLAILATIAGLGVLIIFYLLSYVADSEQMRMLATSEMWQVVITGVMIAIFVGAEAFASDVFAPAFAKDFGAGEGMTHMEYAQAITSEVSADEWTDLRNFNDWVVVPQGSLSSMSGNCYFFGTGYTYAGCSSIAIPFSSASFALRVMSTALLAVNSQLMLLNIASRFVFPVLLPFGLFLRSFHATRGTGGFLIAFGVAFYFVYPMAIIVTRGLYDMVPLTSSLANPEIDDVSVKESWDLWSVDIPSDDCNPFALDYGYTQDQIDLLFQDSLLGPLLYKFFFGGLFNTALNILIALSVLRTLTRVFGTEVDVSALGRIS